MAAAAAVAATALLCASTVGLVLVDAASAAAFAFAPPRSPPWTRAGSPPDRRGGPGIVAAWPAAQQLGVDPGRTRRRRRGRNVSTLGRGAASEAFPLAAAGGGDANDDGHLVDYEYDDDGYDDEVGYDDEDDLGPDVGPPPPAVFGGDDEASAPSRSEAEALTVAQLRQQLRLRGKKVSGRKSELVDRLLNVRTEDDGAGSRGTEPPPSPPREAVGRDGDGARGGTEREPVDVTAYLDEDEKGKDFRSSTGGGGGDDNDDGETPDGSSRGSPYGAEIWGDEARIVDDYEGRSVVVDCLSRTVVEFGGHGGAKVRAYVSASRDALRAYMAGGMDGANNATDAPEGRVRAIQEGREREARVTRKDFSDVELPDTGDEAGHYENVLERDYGDWGVYSPTGAQISARQVQGVLLLPDVRGPFHRDTEALADKIAFECQPVVVMAPDLFRGRPWAEDAKSPGFNDRGESYEEWRAAHADGRVSVDVRAAAAVLRRKCGVSSVAVFGTCYGGGRALEAAAGWQPEDHDIVVPPGDGEREGVAPPPPVNPTACIAWYPTRYDAAELFGPERAESAKTSGGEAGSVAVMAIFAGEDTIPGARPEDAERLKDLLEADERVRDRMVKVFPNQPHGFAHVGMGQMGEEQEQEGVDGGGESKTFLEEEFGGAGGSLSMDSGDAEVACLLSTAWMETYTRAFLPTTGVAVKDDEDQSWSELEMKDLTEANNRDIRKELEEAVRNHKDVAPDLSRMPSYQYGNEIEEMENMGDLPVGEAPPRPMWDEKLIEVAEDLKRIGASPNDDDELFLSKIKNAYDEGKLQSWLGDIDMENPPDVPRSDMGYDEEFGGKFIEAMDELNRVGLSEGDDMSTVVKKLKGALDRGDLRGLQNLKADRARRKSAQKDAEAAKRAATMKQLERIGVAEDDDLDTTYKKLKQAIDRGDFDKLRNELRQEATGRGGRLWEDEEEGPW